MLKADWNWKRFTPPTSTGSPLIEQFYLSLTHIPYIPGGGKEKERKRLERHRMPLEICVLLSCIKTNVFFIFRNNVIIFPESAFRQNVI